MRKLYLKHNWMTFSSVSRVQSRDALLARVVTAVGDLRPTLSAAKASVKALWSSSDDPPIPQGATKFSYSTRLGEVHLRLCDTDLDFLDFRVAGLESDCLFKANERMILRTNLTSITCEDLSDMTLYHRVLQVSKTRLVFKLKKTFHPKC